MLFQKVQKTPEISPPDTLMKTKLLWYLMFRIPRNKNHKNFVNFWGRPSIRKIRPDLKSVSLDPHKEFQKLTPIAPTIEREKDYKGSINIIRHCKIGNTRPNWAVKASTSSPWWSSSNSHTIFQETQGEGTLPLSTFNPLPRALLLHGFRAKEIYFKKPETNWERNLSDSLRR